MGLVWGRHRLWVGSAGAHRHRIRRCGLRIICGMDAGRRLVRGDTASEVRTCMECIDEAESAFDSIMLCVL